MNKPFSTRGGCVPVVRDSHHLLVHNCRRPIGGDRTVQSPGYVLTVTNGTDGIEDLFADENSIVVVDDALESLALNQ